MSKNTPRIPGRHFLQIPGPAPVPDRILRAMDRAVIDHRGPEFQQLGKRALDSIKTVFKTKSNVFIYPSSGTGAWEAALTNSFSPGDKILMYETGHFATLWKNMAVRMGLKPEFIESDWRTGADPEKIGERLRADKNHEIKAVCVVHNETSTGITSPVQDIRKAIDAAKHPALFLIDTVSALASMDFRHDEWGVDVTVCGSQKGLMLPPGLGFTAASEKAIKNSKNATLPKSFFAWDDMIGPNAVGFFPYTPATNLLYGLVEAIDMLHEEGLDRLFARHKRHAEATRRAVRGWGLEILCTDPKCYSPVVTAILMPQGHDADQFRKTVLETFDMSLGAGLSKVAGKVFRIGHLGDTNDLTILGALSGVEMALEVAGVPHKKGGTQAAMDYLAQAAKSPMQSAAE
ncbi:MAG: aminotransferase class V-fold PLP-dependent enzyme [Alphaproteobacteria bacterium]|nr:aminotransferase class V-fold PLP-dependent enzyme [Alphaproteobacteria bacterium]